MSEQGQYTEGRGTPSVRRPQHPRSRFRAALAGTGTRRRKAVAVVATAALGFGGAAAIDQFALAAPAVATASDLGPAGDGLTRLVVTPTADGVTDAELAALQAVPGVVHVQRVFDGSALVATRDLAPADLAGVVPGADVALSPTGSVAGGTVDDPYWSTYGYNLANTGSNAYGQTTVAGADVDAPTGWRAGTGTGMVVAVTDTGMDTSHPDLQGALWTNPAEACGATTDTDGDGRVGDCHGWNFYRNNSDIVNAGGNDHGTGVAGIAGARAGNGEGSAGVAPGVQIMPLVIGYGESVDITAAAAAIDYAVAHGADVINASWGGNGMSSALRAALDRADAAGVLVVAAAGNDSGNRDAVPFYPANYASPAVLSVGSSTAADTISSFSGYGATTVDLFAPGQRIFSPAPGGGYSLMNGTSMAAPEVAAAVALYRAHYGRTLPMTQLRQQLLDDTEPVAAFAGRSVTGGRLSLTALGNTAADVQYSFTSMVADPGTVTPQVVVNGSTPASGRYSVRFGLGEEYRDELFAVSGQALTLAGTTLSTDESGEAQFDLGTRASAGPLVLSPSTELQAARYVLTVQMFRDGAPVGLRFAAPLLVGQPTAASPTTTAAAPTTAGSAAPRSTSTPTGTSTPRATGTAPSAVPTVGASAAPTASATGAAPTTGAAGASTTARSSSSAPPTGTSSSPAVPTTRAASPSTTRSATTSAGAPTTSAPGATGSSTAAPTSTRSTTAAPGTTARPSSAAPGTSSAPSSSAAPGPGGSISYPPAGDFGLTSISPSRVGVAGGTRVTVTGTAIPANAVVRIGATTSAVVSTVSTTQLVFIAPAMAAGSYDVVVSLPGGGRSSTLAGGLTYLAGGSAPSSSAGAAPSSTSSAGPTSSAPATPTWVTGPHGERLVRSTLFRSLAPAIWKVNCASACSGRAV